MYKGLSGPIPRACVTFGELSRGSVCTCVQRSRDLVETTTLRYILFTKLAETSLRVQSSNAKKYLTRADWKSRIVVIGYPHCYSKIFRSIVETSKRGHRIENKDGGQKQLSNVEFSKWEKNIWPYRVSTHKVQSTTRWLDSCFSSSNEKTLERAGWKTPGRWNSALGRKKPLMS